MAASSVLLVESAQGLSQDRDTFFFLSPISDIVAKTAKQHCIQDPTYSPPFLAFLSVL